MSEVCTKLTDVQKSQQRNSTDVGDDDFISFDSVMKVPINLYHVLRTNTM